MNGILTWMAENLGPALFMLLAYVIVPAGIALFAVRASVLQVACAYVFFYVVLFLVLGGGTFSDEVLGFTIIFGMFFSWAAIPLVSLAFRLANVPYRFLN